MRRPLKAETIERISAAQNGKAAEFTVTFALDYYRQSYQKQYTAMLRGEVYSKIAMDNALENIMKIACDDEAHIRYGEVLAEQDDKDAEDFLREPTDAELKQIEDEEKERASDTTWLSSGEQADASYGTLDPSDPRTAEQKALDEWQADTNATRREDYPR